MSITGIINEEWRSVSGYANYQVSNIGRVRNVKTEKILKPNIEKPAIIESTFTKRIQEACYLSIVLLLKLL